jgi:RNA polymerase sigma factor (sigma-70 family)
MPTFVYPTTAAPVSFDVLLAKMMPHFRYYAKRLIRRKGSRRFDFDDVIQELVGFALETYRSLIRRGKEVYFTPIMKYAIKRYREGRRFAIGSNTTDILSEQTQKLGRSDTCQLSVFDGEPGHRGFCFHQQQPDVFDMVQMRIDFSTWLTDQTPRDQNIIKALSHGFTTNEVAKMHGVSASLISQYRKKYADSWNAYIADKRETA